MRNVSLRLVAIAAALAVAAPAAATNGMRMIGFGPVQNSMGGAAAALPLDSSTIVTNPSGMSALERRLDLSGTAFMPSPSYSAPGAGSGSTIDSDRPTDFLPTVGAIYRTAENLSVGVVALGTAGMGVDYPADLFNSPTLTSYAIYRTAENLSVGVVALGTAGMGVDYPADLFNSPTLTSYTNFRVAPAVSYRLSDRLSVGVAANLMWATMKYNVLEALQVSPRDTANSFGIGGTIGVTYRAPEDITLAAAYETRSYFQDFEFDIPAHNQVVGFDGNGDPIVAPIPGGTEKLAFDQPDVVTLGAAFHPLEALLVATDFQWIRWSTTNGVNQPELKTDPNLTGAPTFNLSWKDQVVFKIGAQYDVTKEIKVRAGYNYGSMQLDASRAFENIAFPAVSKHHFTVGGGYSFGTIAVNAAILYSPVESISGSNAQQNIPSYETKMSQLSFDLGASWKF